MVIYQHSCVAHMFDCVREKNTKARWFDSASCNFCQDAYASLMNSSEKTSFQLGPFMAEELIAMGGMGDIWRGQHADQDVLVAIKVLRRNSSDVLNFSTVFRREVRAVAQLDHPGIIRLFDIGEVPESAASESDGALDAGSPYLVMEYLHRGSLESLELPLPWAQTKEILSAVLDALAHAHARGITHRDLKPGNILLADQLSESPVLLTDFGIAFSLSELQSEVAEGRAVGTPTHMAPEQFMAEWRDFGPWTDLYSLGCVAYQLASGRVPFEQTDVLKLGAAHMRDRPPALDCPAGYPDGFSRWVMQLLEKEPEYRFRRCADAAAELTELARKSDARTDASHSKLANRHIAIPDWRPSARTTSPFRLVGAGLRLFGLRPVPIVNRDSERDLLWENFRQVSSTGRARCVVLEGSAGTGKSRLADWLFEFAHERGLAHCLKAEFDRSLARETALSQMLASALSCLRSSEDELRQRVERILQSTNLRSKTSRKAITEFLAPAALGDAYRPGMFYEFQAQSRRFSALLDALSSIFVKRPLLILLDDVHWGVEGLQFARYVLDRSKEGPNPVLMVLTVRDDLVVDMTEASEMLQTLCENDAADCVHVGPLATTDSRTLVNRMLYLEGDLAESVRSRSGGNPLYATQLVGDWVDRGVLEAGKSGFVLSGATQPSIPDDVHSVWVQRLERVLDESIDRMVRFPPPNEQRLQTQIALELASALGGRIDADEWAAVTSLAGVSDPMPILESLLASRLARSDDRGWTFSHNMLRESIERIAREKRRWTSHNRLCAEMLEKRRPVPHWGDSERVGRYRFAAAQFDEAVEPLLRGARERMRLEEYGSALELVDLCDRAIDELTAPKSHSSRMRSMRLRAEIKCTRNELEEAASIATALKSIAEREQATRFEGAALLVLARVGQQEGALSKAIDHYVDAEAHLRTANDDQNLAECLSEKASALLDVGRLDAAWDAFNEAQEIFEETGRLLPWAQNQLGLARVALLQGDPDHANSLCRRARAFARREQLSLVEANASIVLAEIQMAEGSDEDASDSLDKSIELFEQLGLDRQELYPRLLRVLMGLESGSSEQAKSELRRLWSGPDIDAPWIATLLMSCLALVVDVDEAPEDFNAAVEEVAELLGETEVLHPHVVRCLQLAFERAFELGFPERASQIRELSDDATRNLGEGAR